MDGFSGDKSDEFFSLVVGKSRPLGITQLSPHCTHRLIPTREVRSDVVSLVLNIADFAMLQFAKTNAGSDKAALLKLR